MKALLAVLLLVGCTPPEKVSEPIKHVITPEQASQLAKEVRAEQWTESK